MLNLLGFQGEIPRVESRMLPPTHAEEARNVKLESGALQPYRLPRTVEVLPSVAQTIYRHGTEWLFWNADVDVVPGPVATDRLYITGNGAPKVKIGADVYPLALPPPSGRPTAALRANSEFLVLDGADVRLIHDKTVRTSANAWTVEVSVSGATATVTCTHAGATPAQVANLVNGLRYRTGPANAIPSLKIVRITRVRDSGGQTLDENRNPLGSPTRVMQDVGTTVRVGGTTLTYDFPAPDAQSNTNVGAQNDPPTFSTTGLAPVYAAPGDPAVALFDATTVSTIEPGQGIIFVEIEVQGLTNGAIDPDTFEVYRHAYTYVTVLDEESAPSNLTRGLRWSAGQVARISGFAAPPAGRGIDRIRVYRSQTGDTGQTDLYFVGEIPVGTTFFDDSLDDIPIQEAISTVDFDQPPDNINGLVAMPNGMMAAFRDKEVLFCEPYKPHAWPRKYRFNVGWKIVGLASIGSALAIMTTGQPTIAEGTHPENLRSRKLEVDLPCLSARSIVDFGGYVAYASHRGLVVLDQGGARLVTEELFTREDWTDLGVDTFRCGQYAGRYIISHDPKGNGIDKRCTIIDLTGKAPFIVRTGWKPRTFHYETGRGRLFFLDGDRRTVKEFDSLVGQHSRLRWRSKLFVHPEPVCYGRILVSAEKVAVRNAAAPSTLAVRIYADGEQIATIGSPNRILTLPAGFMARRWQVEITGTYKVHAVYMGDTPEEIAQVAQV